MTDSEIESSSPRRTRRLTSTEIRNILQESESEVEEDSYVASDKEEYIPDPQSRNQEESDAEQDFLVEEATEYDSDESVECESLVGHEDSILISKDKTEWHTSPFPKTQTISRNILRQKPGPVTFSSLYTEKEVFKSIMSAEMCDIILRETNRKGKKVTDNYNDLLIKKYPDESKRPPPKVFKFYDEQEIDAFLGILIATGVHRNNKENVDELWALDALPLVRAAMSRDRFKMLLRFIRFDSENTREERLKTDKAAPIRDLWIMLNKNLEKSYKPFECITIDEQLFPFRGRTRFTQYIPSKPAKYGIKVFWACDSANAYPLQGQLYTGKLADGSRQVNVGERIVLDLVSAYKGSGRNVTTDNFFTSLQLAKVLNSWNMTLVGTVRKNKIFLPHTMQPSKERAPLSTNFAFSKDATVCSYVPKKNKSVILLSSMHMTEAVDETSNGKPEIIKYYNKTKGGVDTMDKMLSEYTVKRKTLRWPLAFFYNMVDVAALAAYIIYREHNPRFKANDRRRKFLKNLARQLCLPAVEARNINPHIIKNYFVCTSMEMVLGRKITNIEASTSSQKPFGSQGTTPVVGSCHICRSLNHKQRKTRKSCLVCLKAVCNEHSVAKNTCIYCNQEV